MAGGSHTSSRKQSAVMLTVLWLLQGCAEQPITPQPAPQSLDSTATTSSDTIISHIATHDTLAEDTPRPRPAHVETQREKKERFYRENYGKPNHHKLGVPVFSPTGSTGRRSMDIPGDTVEIEVK
jgi:hypothetical protein